MANFSSKRLFIWLEYCRGKMVFLRKNHFSKEKSFFLQIQKEKCFFLGKIKNPSFFRGKIIFPRKKHFSSKFIRKNQESSKPNSRGKMLFPRKKHFSFWIWRKNDFSKEKSRILHFSEEKSFFLGKTIFPRQYSNQMNSLLLEYYQLNSGMKALFILTLDKAHDYWPIGPIDPKFWMWKNLHGWWLVC